MQFALIRCVLAFKSHKKPLVSQRIFLSRLSDVTNVATKILQKQKISRNIEILSSNFSVRTQKSFFFVADISYSYLFNIIQKNEIMIMEVYFESF